MSEEVKFKISPLVGAFIKPEVSSAHKLAGLGKVNSIGAVEHVTLIFCLLRDSDPAVRKAASEAWMALPEKVALNYLESSDAHPAIMDLIVKAHHSNPWIVQMLLENPRLSAPARAFLLGRASSGAAASTPETETTQPSAAAVAEVSQADSPPESPATPDGEPLPQPEVPVTHEMQQDPPDSNIETDAPDAEEIETADEAGEDDGEEPPGEIDEDGEEFLSKYKIAMVMGIGEKIKMALTGDKEWRSILIKDANKLVSGSVIKNPRITDGEILTVLKAGIQNDEIVRLIIANKEWTKNYMIRKALIECPRTPLPNALRFLSTLNEKDVASYAKSKNISSVISTQAKRLLLAKKR